MKKLYTIVCCLMLAACSNFLEEYSQDKAYVRSYEDLDELLLGNAYFSRYPAREWALSGNSGNFYYAWVHVIADELTQYMGNGNSWSDYSPGRTMYGFYCWQERVDWDQEGRTAWNELADFRHLYAHINACNMILEELKVFENTDDEEDVQNITRIKGECHFLRGSCYFLLANFYGKPYDVATASTDLAVPIKLSNWVEDVIYTRNTVAEVYEQVLEDLNTAELYLKDVPKKSLWRADINAVRLMLSRVYLYMCNYEEAQKYAATVTGTAPRLEDLNHYDREQFLEEECSELIFSTGSAAIGASNIVIYGTSSLANTFRISDELYAAYDPEHSHDLRLEHFIVNDEGTLRYKKLWGDAYTRTPVSDVFALRTAEAYLNLAEAAACAGDESAARGALNALREKRIEADFFDPAQVDALSGEELVKFVREERRRELCLEGHRWFDLRRYRVAKAYPEEITLTHIHVNKVRNQTTGGYDIQWQRRFVLPSDDPAWVLPIPLDEIDKNTGMENNPREERSFELLNN